jgi:hypothetical protein
MRNTPPQHPTWEDLAMHADPETPDEATDNGGGRHHAKEGADRHPLINLDRDPTPGVPDHAAPEDD